MRYTDTKGRTWTLTRQQAVWLESADQGGFWRGWGGMSSTLAMRLLRERGLLLVTEYPTDPRRWKVTGLTALGREVLARWSTRGQTP